MENFSLRTKALLPVLVMCFTVATMVAIAVINLSTLSAVSTELIAHRETGANAIARLGRTIMSLNADVAGLLIFDTDTEIGKAIRKDFAELSENVDRLLDMARKELPDNAVEIEAIRSRFNALRAAAEKPFRIAIDSPSLESGAKLKPEELDQMASGAKLAEPIFLNVMQLGLDLKAYNQRLRAESKARADELSRKASETFVLLTIVGIIATLVAGGLSYWISSTQIAKPLVRLGERMAALAKGDLSVVIDGQTRRDEIGSMAQAVQVFKDNGFKLRESEAAAAESRALAEAERQRNEDIRAKAAAEQAEAMERLAEGLKRLAGGDLTSRLDDDFSASYVQIRDDFNEAANKLRQTMCAIVASAQTIRSGTNEISTASDDLSRRTEQQAASLEQTAAALDTITTTVKKSAEGADHALGVVTAADSDAKNSAIIVGQAVAAMNAIAKSSEQVTQIIGVIDEIAFQTNLLALNAGVEAARAGEVGRGFAVVASEVRALAQRSAEAAKEIKELIFTATAQVENGVKQVGETGKALDRIMHQVIEINEIVSEIAAGAKEQATSLTEINSAINQMDQVTQQNAAMVEESTSASFSLSEETAQLTSLIKQFRVDENDSGDTLRHELRKVAPHAFRTPVAVTDRGRQSAPAITGIVNLVPANQRAISL
ncbi:methyl-accepting chemotaxis protein [Beijerinckia mobilis]|uniref:methyl-accepting chemotaxis protein n=1 Tax=Beijerinckia mobilis TaxID=231434 RepID=UPI00068FC982|nr:methyl-accepting chemotaxis protein [Beijerinckia mobilis]